MKRKHASIAHIAEHCNLSKSTVSRVLNNQFENFPIAPKTADKVRAAAKELGYRPSRLARALTTRRSYLIGVSFPRSPHILPFDPDERHTSEFRSFGEYTYTVVAHPLFKKYDLVVHWRDDTLLNEPTDSDWDENEYTDVSDELHSDLLDGLIYFNPSKNFAKQIMTVPKNFPLVVVGHPEQQVIDQFICVDIDNRDMTRQAAAHMIECGRDQILMLVPDFLSDLYCMHERIAGFHDALTLHGHPDKEQAVLMVPSDPARAEEFLLHHVKASSANALLCATDDLAAQSLIWLAKNGLRVPEDLAVMGFSDTEVCNKTTPTLSSVQVPINRIVYEAADELLSVLENKKRFIPGFRPVPSKLILRGSTP